MNAEMRIKEVLETAKQRLRRLILGAKAHPIKFVVLAGVVLLFITLAITTAAVYFTESDQEDLRKQPGSYEPERSDKEEGSSSNSSKLDSQQNSQTSANEPNDVDETAIDRQEVQNTIEGFTLNVVDNNTMSVFGEYSISVPDQLDSSVGVVLYWSRSGDIPFTWLRFGSSISVFQPSSVVFTDVGSQVSGSFVNSNQITPSMGGTYYLRACILKNFPDWYDQRGYSSQDEWNYGCYNQYTNQVEFVSKVRFPKFVNGFVKSTDNRYYLTEQSDNIQLRYRVDNADDTDNPEKYEIISESEFPLLFEATDGNFYEWNDWNLP